MLLISAIFGAFFASVETALAYATYSGSPEGSSKPTDYCFTARPAGDFFSHEYCYADQPTCQAALDGVPSTDHKLSNSCVSADVSVSDIAKAAWNLPGTIGKSIGNALLNVGSDLLAKALNVIAVMINGAAAIFLKSMGYILDEAISHTINPHIYRDLAVVNVGWTAVRDISNMFFIFVLLYIAIELVLGIAGGSAKRMVANVIIAAVLINFSLFFSQVVIDAGNVLANGFWDQLTSKQGSLTVKSASAQLLEGFRIQSAYSDTDNMNKDGPEKEKLDPWKILLINIGGAILMFIAGYLFLAGAIMMIIRTVTLLLVMIASPFAFLSLALPKFSIWGEWLGKLTGATFVAPVFLFMLYLDSIIITTTDKYLFLGPKQANLSMAFADKANNFDVIYNFVVMAILLLATMRVAHAVSNGVGSSAGGLAKKAIGMGTGYIASGIAAGGRQIGGRYGANKLKDEKWVEEQNRLVEKGGMAGRMANLKLAAAGAAKTGTWDIRNAPGNGLGLGAALGVAGVKAGSGSKRSYEKTGSVGRSMTSSVYRGTEKEKEIIETAKERYEDDAKAREAYLKQELGARYEDDAHKDLRNETKRQVAIQNDKEVVKSELKKAKEEGREIGDAVAKQLKDIFAKYSGKEAMGMIKTSDLENNPQVQALLNKQMLAYMASSPEKYQQSLLNETSRTIMERGSDGARQYLIQQAKMQNPSFAIDLNQELKKQTEAYEKEVSTWDETTADVAARAKHMTALEQHDSAIQDILGAMKPKDVARVDLATAAKPVMVTNYSDKHYDEFQKYHRDILAGGDVNQVKDIDQFARMRQNAIEKGSNKQQNYMRTARLDKNSVYRDNVAIANYEAAKAEQNAAQAEMDHAKSSNDKDMIKAAQERVNAAKEKMAKIKGGKNKNEGGEDDDENDDNNEQTS